MVRHGSDQPAAGTAPREVDGELPLLMVRALKAMVAELTEKYDEGGARARGFTPVHGLALRFVDARPGATTVELADHLFVTKQSASEIVGLLEREGYLERRPHPEDRRARGLWLTEAGREAVVRSRSRWAALVDEWAADAGAADLVAAHRALLIYLARVDAPR